MSVGALSNAHLEAVGMWLGVGGSAHPLWVMAGAQGGTLLAFRGDRQWWGLVLTSCPCLCRFLPSFFFYLPGSRCVGVACRLIRRMMGLLGWLDGV